MEPEQHASAGRLGADSHYSWHLWDEVTLAVRGHVLLCLLLAHRGPLELLHKLPSLVKCTLWLSESNVAVMNFLIKQNVCKVPFQLCKMMSAKYCLLWYVSTNMSMTWPFVQGGAKDVVRGPGLRCRAPRVCHEETGSWALWVPARPASPAGHHHESQHAYEQRHPGKQPAVTLTHLIITFKMLRRGCILSVMTKFVTSLNTQ